MYKMVSSVGVISHINKEAQSFHKSTDESNDENEEEVKAPNDRNHEIFAPIPTSLNDLGLRFLTGRSAILTAINRPSVIKRFDHAVVKDIRECVFDMLCTKLPADSLLNFDRGTLPGHTGNATSLHECDFVRSKINALDEMQRNDFDKAYPSLNIVALMWGDDFQGNNTKQERSGVHVKTVTFILGNGIEMTYPIAISQKGTSHSSVENMIFDQIKMLEKPFYAYYRPIKKLVPVRVVMSAHLYDTPERRDVTNISRGNGKFSGRWGFSAPIPSIFDKFRACKSCWNATRRVLENFQAGSRSDLFMDENDNDNVCMRCSDWSIHSKLLQFEVDENYPDEIYCEEQKLLDKVVYVGEDRYLLPIELTWDVLGQITKITFQKIVSGEWKKDRAEVVMQRFCLNTLYRSVLVENALNQKKWNEAESNMDKDDESAALFQSLRLRRSERQDLFDLPNVGAWRYDHGSLLSHPEVPIHLLLLGVSKNIMLGILQWAVSRRQGSSLRGDLSKMIDRLCKLSLNYVKPYRYGTG